VRIARSSRLRASRRAAGAVTQSGAKRRRGEAEANIDLADCDDVVAE
jgi:hypothetical protein